jgi:peptidoglycan/LPS O-acetylase OafA/YrhL
MNSENQKKIFILDALRGLIALFIASYHFINFESHFGRVILETDLLSGYINPLLEGSVSTFFIISAYVIYLHLVRHDYNYSLLGKFLLKRLIRLHIPIVFCIMAIVAVNNGFNLFLGHEVEFSMVQFLANLTLTVPWFEVEWYNPILWTLSIEFQFYLVIALIFPLIKKQPGIVLLILAGALIPFNYYFVAPGSVAYYGPYFIIGMAMFLVKDSQIKWQLLNAILVLAIVDLVLNHPPLYPLIPLASVYIILFVSIRVRFAEWFGNISYSFYLMHGLFGGKFIYFFGRDLENWTAKFLVVIGALIVAFIGSYIFYQLIEKPSHRLSSKLNYKK